MTVQALRELVASFTVEVNDKPLDALSGKLEKAKESSFDLGERLKRAAAAAGAALVAMAYRSLAAAKEISALSAQLGISTDAIQEWRSAANATGADIHAVDAGLRALSATVGAARLGSDEAAAAFDAIGVSLVDANGVARGTSTILEEVGGALASVPDPATRGALAMRLFGRQGRALLPIFADGSAGLVVLRKRFRDLGGGVGADALKQAKQLGDAFDDLSESTLSLGGEVVAKLGPALRIIVDGATSVSRWLVEMSRRSRLFEAAAIAGGVAAAAFGVRAAAAGTAAAVAWLKAAAPLIAFGAGVALIALLVEDLWVAMEGGDSVLGEILEYFTGISNYADWLVESLSYLPVAFRDLFGIQAPDEDERDRQILASRQRAARSNRATLPDMPQDGLGRVARFSVSGAMGLDDGEAPRVRPARAASSAPLDQGAGYLARFAVSDAMDAAIARPATASVRRIDDARRPAATINHAPTINVTAQGTSAAEVVRLIRERETQSLRDAVSAVEQEGGD